MLGTSSRQRRPRYGSAITKPHNKGMKQTKPSVLELRSLSPVFGGPVTGPETSVTEAELVEAIRALFPPGLPLSPAAIIAHACEECQDVSASFAERQWPEIPADDIDAHHDSLPLLTPEAYREFLPAYMIRGLERPDDPCGPNDVLEFTTYSRLPDNASQWWLARVGGLDGTGSWQSSSSFWHRLLGDRQTTSVSLQRRHRRIGNREAAEQGDEADEAGASDGASQLIPGVRRTPTSSLK